MKSEILSDIYGMRIEIEEYKGKKICVYYQQKEWKYHEMRNCKKECKPINSFVNSKYKND